MTTPIDTLLLREPLERLRAMKAESLRGIREAEARLAVLRAEHARIETAFAKRTRCKTAGPEVEPE